LFFPKTIMRPCFVNIFIRIEPELDEGFNCCASSVRFV
jgi:hypothetical protein